MITLPKKLKIGAHTYEIVEEKANGLGVDSCGKHNMEDSTITVDGDLSDTHKVQTLFHEIFHALNGELTEQEVDWLSQGITQVLLDNNLLKL